MNQDTDTTRLEEDNAGLAPIEPAPDPGRRPGNRFAMQVLWPAFLGAAAASGVLFSVIDPRELDAVHLYLADSREAAYTVGFITLWMLISLACSMTHYLATSNPPSIPKKRF